ncbi:hypothetical protein EW145_g6713 [Phellinidium pouzarii]|uniref:Hemerythrin-like domain-containing protein n=1 Tax=Phellinidium pouzarii TaxID=167371 RepID=A0A4S4KVG1_9AGAM|nr:hypothetical protein EW145_g6713 [Phellinidium pouzarii]
MHPALCSLHERLWKLIQANCFTILQLFDYRQGAITHLSEFQYDVRIFNKKRSRTLEQVERVYKLADGSFTNYRMSLQMFLREADSLKNPSSSLTDLEAHHSIEERFIFPVLANKMPSFAEDDQHRKSHEAIHEGLNKLGALTREFRETPTSYSPERMCGEVLMRHLDEEVADLSGDNMKKFWTLEEVDRISI